MILTGSHRRTVSRLGMLTIALFALLTAPAWSVGQGLGSTDDETPATEKAVPVDATDDGAEVEAEVVEEIVVVSDDASRVPVIVNVEDVVEIPVLTIDGGQEEIGVPVRVQNAQPGRFGQAVIGGDAAGDSPRRFGVVKSAGDDVSLTDREPIAIAGNEDVYRGGADRRIQRMEKNIQKLERSLEAVLSELRSLRRERRSSGDAFGGRGVGGRGGRGGRGFGEVSEGIGRRGTSTSRRSMASESSPGAVNTPRRTDTRRGSSSLSGGSPSGVEPSLPQASDDGTFGESTSRRRRSTRSSRATVVESSPGVRSTRSARSSRSPSTRTAENPALAPALESSEDDSGIIRQVSAYKLPGGKAKALAKFLRENVTAEMQIQMKSEDTIWITASRDTQKTIARLIDLLTPKKARRSQTGGTSRLEIIY